MDLNSKAFSVLTEDGCFSITINTEKFTAKDHKEFRKFYQELPKYKRCIIDFNRVRYIDSAALGMLMVLWNHFGIDKEPVRVINCEEGVSKQLNHFHLNEVFEIVENEV
jgi:HptB-dependent secretion and biofilm anti anti-sigma factor